MCKPRSRDVPYYMYLFNQNGLEINFRRRKINYEVIVKLDHNS